MENGSFGWKFLLEESVSLSLSLSSARTHARPHAGTRALRSRDEEENGSATVAPVSRPFLRERERTTPEENRLAVLRRWCLHRPRRVSAISSADRATDRAVGRSIAP